MRKKDLRKRIVAAISMALILVLLLMLGGCGKKSGASPEPAEPAANAESASPAEAEPAEPSEAEIDFGRQDGERFEDVIILEGMEETVHYEHVRNGNLGFEMDYDYELFVRHSEPDREWFVSCWDDSGKPENYLEVRYSPLDAETAAALIGETLSNEYEISRDDSFMLGRAGSCIRIDASEARGGGWMPDQLQMVYVIPAADGCRVAAAHYAIEGGEGFGRRFRYMMDTFSAIAGDASLSVTGTWQTASMGYSDDGTMQPEHYVRFTNTQILYGHLQDGQFVLDYADRISSLGETAAGGLRIQAEASNGIQYTYQTSESDNNVLECYETWREEDFPEMYRGGASLGRIS